MSYSTLIPAAQDFFAQLAENNNREWFIAKKTDYDATIAAPSKAFAEEVAEALSETLGRPYRAKLFRVHRDVRFSKDKSPYKTHLHMSFADVEEAQKQNKFDMQNDHPSFFCGIDPGGMHYDEALEGEDFTIKAPAFWFMMGFLGFSKARLEVYRRFIDVHGDDLAAKMAATDQVVSGFGADAYKRVPGPYAADHTHEALLRRKSLVIGRDLQEEFEAGSDPMTLVKDQIKALKPLAEMVQGGLVRAGCD